MYCTIVLLLPIIALNCSPNFEFCKVLTLAMHVIGNQSQSPNKRCSKNTIPPHILIYWIYLDRKTLLLNHFWRPTWGLNCENSFKVKPKNSIYNVWKICARKNYSSRVNLLFSTNNKAIAYRYRRLQTSSSAHPPRRTCEETSI